MASEAQLSLVAAAMVFTTMMITTISAAAAAALPSSSCEDDHKAALEDFKSLFAPNYSDDSSDCRSRIKMVYIPRNSLTAGPIVPTTSSGEIERLDLSLMDLSGEIRIPQGMRDQLLNNSKLQLGQISIGDATSEGKNEVEGELCEIQVYVPCDDFGYSI